MPRKSAVKQASSDAQPERVPEGVGQDFQKQNLAYLAKKGREREEHWRFLERIGLSKFIA